MVGASVRRRYPRNLLLLAVSLRPGSFKEAIGDISGTRERERDIYIYRDIVYIYI